MSSRAVMGENDVAHDLFIRQDLQDGQDKKTMGWLMVLLHPVKVVTVAGTRKKPLKPRTTRTTRTPNGMMRNSVSPSGKMSWFV
jgi:hypothetical protein